MGSTSAVTNSNTVLVFEPIDNIGPVVTSVGVPANSTYNGSSQHSTSPSTLMRLWSVNTAGGTPRIAVTVGSTGRFADFIGGSGTTALTFRYTVPSGDEDLDGIALRRLQLTPTLAPYVMPVATISTLRSTA